MKKLLQQINFKTAFTMLLAAMVVLVAATTLFMAVFYADRWQAVTRFEQLTAALDRGESSWQETLPLLQDTAADYPGLIDLVVTDPAGNTVYTANQTHYAQKLADQPQSFPTRRAGGRSGRPGRNSWMRGTVDPVSGQRLVLIARRDSFWQGLARASGGWAHLTPPKAAALVLLLVGKILVAAWVYSDSHKQGRNAPLWGLAVLLSRLPVVLLYLFVRSRPRPAATA